MKWITPIFLCSSLLWSAPGRVINGEIVDMEDHKSIVDFTAGTNGCTATIVGPRVFVTAAHCVDYSGQTATFEIGEKEYEATVTVSPLYFASNLDLAIGLISQPVTDIEYSSIGGKVEQGTEMTFYGYGCFNDENGQTVFDDNLRRGWTTVHEIHGSWVESKMPDGSILCSGDSGGPAFVTDEQGNSSIVAINSAVTVPAQNNVNILLSDGKGLEFVNSFVQNHQVEICGVTKEC